MNASKIIDDFNQDFSREVFNKASAEYLRKNLFIPVKIRDDCLFVVTNSSSNVAIIDDLKFVYDCKSVATVKVDKDDFVEIYNFCFVSSDKSVRLENEKSETITKKNNKVIVEPINSESTNLEIEDDLDLGVANHRPVYDVHRGSIAVVSSIVAFIVLFYILNELADFLGAVTYIGMGEESLLTSWGDETSGSITLVGYFVIVINGMLAWRVYHWVLSGKLQGDLKEKQRKMWMSCFAFQLLYISFTIRIHSIIRYFLVPCLAGLFLCNLPQSVLDEIGKKLDNLKH